MPPIEQLYTYGPAWILLACILLGLWRICAWLAVHAVRPMVQGHLEFLDCMKKHSGEEDQTSTRMEGQLVSINGQLVTLDTKVTTLGQKLDVVIETTASAKGTEKHP